MTWSSNCHKNKINFMESCRNGLTVQYQKAILLKRLSKFKENFFFFSKYKSSGNTERGLRRSGSKEAMWWGSSEHGDSLLCLMRQQGRQLVTSLTSPVTNNWTHHYPQHASNSLLLLGIFLSLTNKQNFLSSHFFSSISSIILFLFWNKNTKQTRKTDGESWILDREIIGN